MRCGLVAHLSVQDRVIVPSLDVAGDTAVFSHAVYQPGMESADQITDGAIACAVNAIRALLGADWAPAEVLLRGQPADAEPYRRHFRAPVRFDQEIAALVSRACLERRIAGADPLLRAMLEERIQQLKGAQGSEFPDDIRRLLRMRLTNDRCSADAIADLLAIHRRTLRRRLKGGGWATGRLPTRSVRDRASVAGGHDGVAGRDCGGPRLFGGERLYAGVPALVRRDPDRLAGEAPPRRAAELTRAAKRLIPTRHRPGRTVDEEPSGSRPSNCGTTSSGTSGDRGCVVRCLSPIRSQALSRASSGTSGAPGRARSLHPG